MQLLDINDFCYNLSIYIDISYTLMLGLSAQVSAPWNKRLSFNSLK